MAIDKTLILHDASRIMSSGITKTKHIYMELFIHGGVYKVDKVIDIVYKYDYTNNYACEIMATVTMGLNDYTTILQTDEGNVRAKVYEEVDGEVLIYNYNVVIDRNNNPVMMTNHSKSNDDRYNLTMMREVSFQLIDPNLLKLRDEICGGTFRNATVTQVMDFFFNYSINRIKEQNTVTDIRYHMHKSDNEKVYPQILIPHGTRLFDLPKYIQEKYGVYDYDIAYFYQGNTVYIYPLYNTQLFEESSDKLVMYCVPVMNVGTPERTFRYEGSTAFILNTHGLNNYDMVNSGELNLGNAILKPNADSIFDMYKPMESDPTKFVSNRTNNTIEYASSDRKDGVQRTNISNEFTSNEQRYFSDNNVKYGKVYEATWELSVNRYVKPGMPIKVIREYNGAYIEEYGTIISFSYSDNIKSRQYFDKEYVGLSLFRIFIKKDKKDTKAIIEASGGVVEEQV
jgi:hypothetical protein